MEDWSKHFGHSIVNEGGYRIVIGIIATLMGTYAGLYAIMEAKHERHLNRALFERSAFMTMVVAGPSGFQSAMNQFEQIQNQMAPIEPTWSRPWQWLDEEKPNREPLRQWAQTFLHNCKPETCGRLAEKDATGMAKEGSLPQRIVLTGAHLGGADLREAILRGADLRGTDLREACLTKADLRGADLRGTDLRGTDLRRADLREAILRGADLTENFLSGPFVKGSFVIATDTKGTDPRETGVLEATGRGADLRGSNLWEANLPPFTSTEVATEKDDPRNIAWDQSTIWPSGFVLPPSHPEWHENGTRSHPAGDVSPCCECLQPES